MIAPDPGAAHTYGRKGAIEGVSVPIMVRGKRVAAMLFALVVALALASATASASSSATASAGTEQMPDTGGLMAAPWLVAVAVALGGLGLLISRRVVRGDG
jgi:Ni/Fe-hydrogenase subunit HybB-like protein